MEEAWSDSRSIEGPAPTRASSVCMNAALRPRREPTAPGATADAAPPEVTLLELHGTACRVLLVDDVIPRHSPSKAGGRLRMTYTPHELAHFEFGGHRYALVAEPADANGAPAPTKDPGQPPTDIRRLLTARELQIVQLICLGFLTKQVADRLKISEFTVRSYLKTTYAKLGVRSRASLVFRYTQAFKLGTPSA